MNTGTKPNSKGRDMQNEDRFSNTTAPFPIYIIVSLLIQNWHIDIKNWFQALNFNIFRARPLFCTAHSYITAQMGRIGKGHQQKISYERSIEANQKGIHGHGLGLI